MKIDGNKVCLHLFLLFVCFYYFCIFGVNRARSNFELVQKITLLEKELVNYFCKIISHR